MQDVNFAIPSRESHDFYEDDLRRNDVFQNNDFPNFVTKYKEELKKPRYLSSPVQEVSTFFTVR